VVGTELVRPVLAMKMLDSEAEMSIADFAVRNKAATYLVMFLLAAGGLCPPFQSGSARACGILCEHRDHHHPGGRWSERRGADRLNRDNAKDVGRYWG